MDERACTAVIPLHDATAEHDWSMQNPVYVRLRPIQQAIMLCMTHNKPFDVRVQLPMTRGAEPGRWKAVLWPSKYDALQDKHRGDIRDVATMVTVDVIKRIDVQTPGTSKVAKVILSASSIADQQNLIVRTDGRVPLPECGILTRAMHYSLLELDVSIPEGAPVVDMVVRILPREPRSRIFHYTYHVPYDVLTVWQYQSGMLQARPSKEEAGSCCIIC